MFVFFFVLIQSCFTPIVSFRISLVVCFSWGLPMKCVLCQWYWIWFKTIIFPVNIIVFILLHMGYLWGRIQRSHFLLWYSLPYEASDEGFSRPVLKGQKKTLLHFLQEGYYKQSCKTNKWWTNSLTNHSLNPGSERNNSVLVRYSSKNNSLHDWAAWLWEHKDRKSNGGGLFPCLISE